MYLLLTSKYLVYPFIWESFMHNGAEKILLILIYPIKYLNEPLLPYDWITLLF